MSYHFWYTSNFETAYRKPLFIKLAIFLMCLALVSNYHSWKGELIKLIPQYMVDIIYKTLKSSHLKKLQIIENINNLMFQIIFIFSERLLIKQIIVYSTPFCYWGRTLLKMPRINAFSSNLNSII